MDEENEEEKEPLIATLNACPLSESELARIWRINRI